MDTSDRHRRLLLLALLAAAACTAVYYGTGVDWAIPPLLGAFTIYCLAVLIAFSPYIILSQIIRIEKRLPLLAVEFLVVTVPAPVLFYQCRHSDGWSFFLVPALQLILALIAITVTLIVDGRFPYNRRDASLR